MEAERLPRGADPKSHFKLGRGGLSDVEWTVQLLQMRHAHEVPALRTTSHPAGAGGGARRPGLLAAGRTPSALRDGVDARLAAAQRRGAVPRPARSTACPRPARRRRRRAGSSAGSRAPVRHLAEDYRRLARRARAAVVSNFYESA